MEINEAIRRAEEKAKDIQAEIDNVIEALKRQGAPTCLTNDERRKELEERYKE